MMKSIKAFAPATIANLNVGYDILGLSLNHIGDTVELSLNDTRENVILNIQNGANLPKESSKNCCSVVIRKMQERLNVFKGVNIKITKGFAAGSGLGSSSASSAAAAFGYNELIGKPFSLKELVYFAAEGERVACGTAHVDNVAPSILGGMVLAVNNDIIRLPLIENLYAVSLLPAIKINTEDARNILKKKVPLKTMSQQVALMGAFVSSLYEKNEVLFGQSIQDLIVEPFRSLLIPKFQILKQQALNNGAVAFGISGSGPSVFALTFGKGNAEHIANLLKTNLAESQISSQTFINHLCDQSGARILN